MTEQWKTSQVLALVGTLLSVVILPAAIWVFLTMMETRDDVQQMKSDISSIKDVFIKEISELRAENEELKSKIHNTMGPQPTSEVYSRGLEARLNE